MRIEHWQTRDERRTVIGVEGLERPFFRPADGGAACVWGAPYKNKMPTPKNGANPRRDWVCAISTEAEPGGTPIFYLQYGGEGGVLRPDQQRFTGNLHLGDSHPYLIFRLFSWCILRVNPLSGFGGL